MPVHPHLIKSSIRLVFLFAAVGFMALEYVLSRLAHHDRDTHDLSESASSLSIAIGRHFIHPFEAGLVALPFAFVYSHRLFHFDSLSLPAVATLFLVTEFVYYWHHRFSHRVRWLWATHAVHHTPTKLNMTAAIRLGWTGNISGNFLFYLPLIWIGFHPFTVIGMLAINLFYQFFIHTEFLPRLGPLEWVLNTPAHHRVHHASNAACLDKNYGGVLIIFDRLFGTFAEAPKDEELRYGLVGGTRILNPLRITFGEWAALAHDVRAAPSLRAKVRALFAAPGSLSLPQSQKTDERANVITIKSASTIIIPGE